MVVWWLLLAVLLVIVVNGAALVVGHGRGGLWHDAATLCGGLGLFCLVALVFALIDALIQIALRPGYTGLPVFVFLYGMGACTLASLAVTLAIGLRDSRARTAQARHAGK